MILTHGANSICREKSNIIYELNINNFDLNTLKDGPVTWQYFYGSETVNKLSDCLEVTRTGSYVGFGLDFSQFAELTDKFICEYEITPQLSGFQYISAFNQGVNAYGGYYSNLGYYFIDRNLKSRNILAGSQGNTWDFFRRYNGINYSFPVRVKNIVDFTDIDNRKIECYYNEIKVSELIYNQNESQLLSRFVMTPDTGASIKLFSFKLYNY